MDPLRIIAIRGRLLLGRPADGDEREGHDLLGYPEQPPEGLHALGHRIDAQPDRAQALGRGGDEDVLGGGRAVLDPIRPVELVTAQIAADQDGQRRLEDHPRVRMEPRYLVEEPPLPDDHELPRLLVPGRGRARGRTKKINHHFLGDRIRQILPDAPPPPDGIHRPSPPLRENPYFFTSHKDHKEPKKNYFPLTTSLFTIFAAFARETIDLFISRKDRKER